MYVCVYVYSFLNIKGTEIKGGEKNKMLISRIFIALKHSTHHITYSTVKSISVCL